MLNKAWASGSLAGPKQLKTDMNMLIGMSGVTKCQIY
jgi:hypothetical protein